MNFDDILWNLSGTQNFGAYLSVTTPSIYKTQTELQSVFPEIGHNTKISILHKIYTSLISEMFTSNIFDMVNT